METRSMVVSESSSRWFKVSVTGVSLDISFASGKLEKQYSTQYSDDFRDAVREVLDGQLSRFNLNKTDVILFSLSDDSKTVVIQLKEGPPGKDPIDVAKIPFRAFRQLEKLFEREAA